MSIGLAFVQGLVGGFQKNIEREQTARDADDQRLAGLQDTLFAATAKAAAEGNPVPKQLGEILKNAKTDVSNRPDIGLFGTGKADRLNLDFTGLAGTINGVDANTINFGSYSLPATKMYADKATIRNDYGHSKEFFLSLQNHFSTEETRKKFLDHFKNNKNDLNILRKEFFKRKKNYLQGWTQDKSKINETDNELVFTELFKDYALGPLQEMFGTSSSTKDTVSTLNSASKNKGSGLPKTIFFKTENKNTAYSYSNFKDLNVLEQIAKNNGYSSTQEYVWDYQELAPAGLLEDVDENNPYASIKSHYKYMFHGVELFKLGAGDILKLDTPEKKKAVKDYIDEHLGGDRYQAVLALAPIIKEPFVAGSELTRNGVIVSGKKREDELFEILGYKKDEFNKAFTNAVGSVNDLKSLLQLESEVKTSAGLMRALTRLGFNIFGPTGQLDQFGQVLFNGGVKDSNNDTAGAFQATIQKYMGSDPSKYGQIESMKISLAAKMARAVDPAGRLSNQDFDMQLQRLGQVGIFTSKIEQVSALKTVIAEFERIQTRLTVMNKIINKPATGTSNTLSSRERRIVYADKQLDTMLKEMGGQGGPLPEGEYIRNIEDLNSRGGKKYIPHGSDPNLLIDTDTNESVKKSDVKGAI